MKIGVFLFFLLVAANGFCKPPEDWVDKVLGLQEKVQHLEDLSLKLLDTASQDLAHLPVPGELHRYYDRSAVIWQKDEGVAPKKIMQVFWESQKTGVGPGPESSLIRSENYIIHSEEIIIDKNHYYRSDIKYSGVERGAAQIFYDIQKQQTKVSISYMEGSLQENLQATIGSAGTIYLREEKRSPVEAAGDQKHLCRNPHGQWVSAGSREWDDFCEPLFDKSLWHGFSYNAIPSFEPFLKN